MSSDANPHATKHPFGPSYQLRELPGGEVIPGAPYAPDPRVVYREVKLALSQSHWPGFPKDLKIADLACNGGFHGIKALREGARECFFVDMHSDAIRVATETARAWDVYKQCTFAVGNIEDFDPGPSFDLMLAHQVIYHLADPIGFLRNVQKALKPGGVFATYTRIAHSVHPRTHEWVPSWSSAIEAFHHVGFKTVSFFGDPNVLKRVHPVTRDAHSGGQEKVLVIGWNP